MKEFLIWRKSDDSEFRFTEEEARTFVRLANIKVSFNEPIFYAFMSAVKHEYIFVDYLKTFCDFDITDGRDNFYDFDTTDSYDVDCDFDDFFIQDEDGKYILYLDKNGLIITPDNDVNWEVGKKNIKGTILGSKYNDGYGIKDNWNDTPTPLQAEPHTTSQVKILYDGVETEVNIYKLKDWEIFR